MQRVIKELLTKRLILLFLNRSTIKYFWILSCNVYFKQKINYHVRIISTRAFVKFLYKYKTISPRTLTSIQNSKIRLKIVKIIISKNIQKHHKISIYVLKNIWIPTIFFEQPMRVINKTSNASEINKQRGITTYEKIKNINEINVCV